MYIFGGLRASRTIHRRLISSVLGTTMKWLDSTPVGRVITQCTQDMRSGASRPNFPSRGSAIIVGTVNGMIPCNLNAVIGMSKACSRNSLLPSSSLPPPFCLVLPPLYRGCCRTDLYQRSALRQAWMRNARSLALSHFGAGIGACVMST